MIGITLIFVINFAITITTASTLQCPTGTTQIGALNADIAGCGLEGCDARYQDNYQTIDDCKKGCEENAECLSFTWAPLNGDKDHNGKTVCTLYDSKTPTRSWSPQQIMCAPSGAPWTDASWSDYSFNAVVKGTKSSGAIAYCGGSILSVSECGRGIILTAAHCVEDAIVVNVGIGCTKTDCTDSGAKWYNDGYSVIHPSYDSSLPFSNTNYMDNNIALVFLPGPITNTNAETISLHSDISVIENNDEIRVFGYFGGCDKYANCIGGSDGNSLEYADTHYMISSECDDHWGSKVTGGHDFCTIDDDGSNGLQSVCAGHMGGPLIFENKQIGFVSWGTLDCDPRKPVVATSIPYYYQWISNTRNNQPQCTSRDTLYVAPDKLTTGKALISADGRFKAILQNDGNFVIYDGNSGEVEWASDSEGYPNDNNRYLVLQATDGNVVLYSGGSSNQVRWASNEHDSKPSHLIMQNDGNLVAYDIYWNAYWDSE